MSGAKLDRLVGQVDYLTGDNSRTQVLMEEMRSQNEAILEYVQDIPKIKNRLTAVESDVAEIKSDVKVIKGVIRVHSVDIELKSKAHTH